MKQIELGYGRESISYSYDCDRYRLIAPSGAEAESPLSDSEIGAALDRPIGSPRLEEIFSAGESVLIVVSDATRATASAQIVNLLVRRLVQIGVLPSDIALIFATGIHRAATPAEKTELLTPFITQRIKTIDHDPVDTGALVRLGITDRGTPVEVSRALTEFSHVIITGGIGFHYFAGFSGGRKSICPGLASVKTIEATHLLALDFKRGGRRAGVGTGLLSGNAVHEECERVAQLINPSFSINSVVDEKGRAVRVYAGDWKVAHARGCEEYLRDHSHEIDAKRDVVIAGCGGFPWDINLIQAHKAMDMASYACKEGGTIVLLAECAEGLGRADFLKWFESADARALEARLRDSYEVNGQTAWALLTKAERFRIYLVSRLPDEAVQRMRMIPARTLTQAVAKVAASAAGYIMPRGAAVLPLTKH